MRKNNINIVKLVSIFPLAFFFFAVLFLSQTEHLNFNSDKVLACGNWDHVPRSNPDFSRHRSNIDRLLNRIGGGTTIGGGTPSCSCSCNTCNPPACPAGTSTTNTGDACFVTRDRRNCGFSCSPSGCGTASGCHSAYRSCWWHENDPAPTEPNGIRIRTGDVVCNLENGLRVPYPDFGSGEGFRANGSINNRATDSNGNNPLLRYRYRLPELGKDSGYVSTSSYYDPSIENLVSGGETHTIYARSNSINRCQGNTDSSEMSRTFQVNHIPEVVSIDPVSSPGNPTVSNPNDSVSGNTNYDGSEHFDCEVENPKTFKVVFEDQDGCGDLWESFNSTPTCDGAISPEISLRAIEPGRETAFAFSDDALEVSCSDNRLIAYFTLEFEGTEVLDLNIQAYAKDILGDSSGWSGDYDWEYDGEAPDIKELNPNIVVGVDSVNFEWEVEDDTAGLSGIRGVNIFSRLLKGEVLVRDGDYGDIEYDGTTYFVSDLLDDWVSVWGEYRSNASEARSYPSRSESHEVNLGINQDGDLDFKFEAVDRACNYSVETEALDLGAPWIATRGGLVHSGGDIRISVRESLYGDIIDSSAFEDEYTSLSTELLTSGSFSTPHLGYLGYVYDLLDYQKGVNVDRAWYETFLSRANSNDPDGVYWGEVGVEAVDLSVCEERQYIYFINNKGGSTFEVDPVEYEELSPSGSLNGCVFMVSGDVNITEGEHKSAGIDPSDANYRPGYDIIRSFFIVDGEINIEFVDRDEDVRDGLKVVGGLFATGGDKSLRLGRSLQMRDNLKFPTLIVFHDARYLDVGRKVLGDTFGGGYIRDIGLRE